MRRALEMNASEGADTQSQSNGGQLIPARSSSVHFIHVIAELVKLC